MGPAPSKEEKSYEDAMTDIKASIKSANTYASDAETTYNTGIMPVVNSVLYKISQIDGYKTSLESSRKEARKKVKNSNFDGRAKTNLDDVKAENEKVTGLTFSDLTNEEETDINTKKSNASACLTAATSAHDNIIQILLPNLNSKIDSLSVNDYSNRITNARSPINENFIRMAIDARSHADNAQNTLNELIKYNNKKGEKETFAVLAWNARRSKESAYGFKDEIATASARLSVSDPAKSMEQIRSEAETNYNSNYTNFVDIDAKIESYFQEIEDKITVISTKKGEITTIYNEIQTYANNHNYTWLNENISTKETDLNVIKKKRDETDNPILTHLEDIKRDYDASMSTYVQMLQTENTKNPYDELKSEYALLTGEYKICQQKIDGYRADITAIDLTISQKRQDIITKGAEYIDLSNNGAPTAHSHMLSAKNIAEDLSGQLFILNGDKIRLEGLITEEERYYGQLLDNIEQLQKTIIEMTINDYSNKVYNNKNLLNLNEKIDYNLKYIFSDLNTKNINPDLLYTKIKYRKLEEEKLTNTNKVLDILFYCFYFSFIIIGIVTRNIYSENIIIYIFIGLIPFIYPFIFKNTKNILFKSNEIESNENNENGEFMVHAYNI